MTGTRTTALVEDLRQRIVTGAIAPGDPLPSENSLITVHGVSRTVVREALGQLRAEGLIRTRRGSGSFALTPPTATSDSGFPPPARTVADRRALLELRTAVESEAAALAAGRRSSTQIAALEHTLEEFSRAEADPATALDLDFAFHRTIAEASGNHYLLGLLDALGPAMITMPSYRLDAGEGSAPGPRLHEVTAEHTAVLAAIHAGDALTAGAAMRAHLAGSRLRMEN